MRLALFQPEIPQNTGTLIRLGACMGVGIDVIEPCGYVWDDARLKRAGMDYMELANVTRHSSWEMFYQQIKPARLILLDTKATIGYLNFEFKPSDILMVGRESDGVPDDVFKACNFQVKIPMLSERRSLNVAVAASIVLGEALRQTQGGSSHDNLGAKTNSI
jgi:tRNA (cytidine/uridine-2'-O-)-methyltransferase